MFASWLNNSIYNGNLFFEKCFCVWALCFYLFTKFSFLASVTKKALTPKVNNARTTCCKALIQLLSKYCYFVVKLSRNIKHSTKTVHVLHVGICCVRIAFSPVICCCFGKDTFSWCRKTWICLFCLEHLRNIWIFIRFLF